MILYVIVINPLATGVENECWLRGWNNFWQVQKWVLTTGMEQKMRRLQLAKRHLIGLQTFYEKVKNDKSKVRTRTQCRTGAYNVFAACATLTLMKCSIYFYNNCEKNLMYEGSCKTIEFLKLVKITTFDQNELMTCYLIFNFRPTYFAYFHKITANSYSHNVKKQVEQKVPSP